MFLGCLLMQNIAFSQTPTYHGDQNWQLKWEDNFNSFDDAKWVKVHLCDHKSAIRLHLADNIKVSNGNLIIRTNDSAAYCPANLPYPPSSWLCSSCTEGWHPYRTGRLETKPAYSTKYGYVEARIKMTYRRGVGYAFWTFKGEGSSQPDSNPAEIDIFETDVPRLQQGKNALSTCVHTCYPDRDLYPWPEIDPNCNSKPDAQHYYLSNFSYEDWHTYAFEWNADKIIWYVDGKAIRTSANRNWDNNGHSIIDPVRLIFSTGITPDSLLNNDHFEEYMYIDYVKVYQLKYDCNTVVVGIPNFATFDYKVKKSITLNRPVSFGTLPRKSFPITLRATDFIELQAGFEAPLGTELYLDINPCVGLTVIGPGGGISTDGD